MTETGVRGRGAAEIAARGHRLAVLSALGAFLSSISSLSSYSWSFLGDLTLDFSDLLCMWLYIDAYGLMFGTWRPFSIYIFYCVYIYIFIFICYIFIISIYLSIYLKFQHLIVRTYLLPWTRRESFKGAFSISCCRVNRPKVGIKDLFGSLGRHLRDHISG